MDSATANNTVTWATGACQGRAARGGLTPLSRHVDLQSDYRRVVQHGRVFAIAGGVIASCLAECSHDSDDTVNRSGQQPGVDQEFAECQVVEFVGRQVREF